MLLPLEPRARGVLIALQDGPKMAPRRPQDGPKEAPRWYQKGTRCSQDGPMRSQDGSKRAQDGPKWSLDGPGSNEEPMLVTCWFHSGILFGSKKHPKQKLKFKTISDTILGPILEPFCD